MAHKVIPLEVWVTPSRAIAKEPDINKNAILVSDADYEWLKEREKELGRMIFKDISEPTKKPKKGLIQKGGSLRPAVVLPKLKREEAK